MFFSPEKFNLDHLDKEPEKEQVDLDIENQSDKELDKTIDNLEIPLEQNKESKNSTQDIELKKEKDFLYSFELAPDQRLELRRFVNDLKNPKCTLQTLININKLESPEILNSPYIQELVKSKYIKMTNFDNYYYPYPSKLIDKFGIEEDFFTQTIFDDYRKKNWLQRINQGINIDNFDRSENSFDWDDKKDPQTIERKKKDEIITYGEFTKIIDNPALPEIKEIAKEGLIYNIEHNVIGRLNKNKDQFSVNSVIREYKKVFNISQEEFEQVVIEQLKNVGLHKNLSLVNIDKIDKFRKHYAFIDDFIVSANGKNLIHQKIEEEMIKGCNVDVVMNYYQLTNDDFDLQGIQEKRKLYEKNDFIEQLNKKSDYLYYSLGRLEKVLAKDDWQEVFSNKEYKEKIFDTLGDELSHGLYSYEGVLSLSEKIGLSNEEVKKIGSLAITKISGSNENFRSDYIVDLKNKVGLSDEEYKRAFSLGVLDTINYNYYELANREEKMKLKVEADLPETQAKLKEVYCQQLSQVNTTALKQMKERFNIKWTEDDRVRREKALKQALCNKFQLDNRFQKAEFIEEFINENLPDKKMAIYLYSDKDIKNSVKEMLIESALQGSSIFKDNRFIDEITKLFDVKDEAMAEIKTKIEDGEFIIFDKTCTSLFPEINVHEENIKCLANHGEEIIEKALENKDGVTLLAILKDYSDTPTGQELKNILAEQEENITNGNKSLAIRAYAVDLLYRVDKNNYKLEEKYFSDLVNIFSETDVSKLYDLFCEKIDKLEELSTNERDLILDKVITNSTEISKKRNDPRLDILRSDIITLLNNEQCREALRYDSYEIIVDGIKMVIKNKKDVPVHIYDNLYSRIKEEDKPPYTKHSTEFVTAIEDLIKTNNSDLLQNQQILKELATKPEAIPVIKKLFELPFHIISGKHQFIEVYEHFKNLPDNEFENHKALLLRLNESKSLLESIDIKLIPILDKLSNYDRKKQEQFFSLIDLSKIRETDFTDNDWAVGLINYVSAAEDNNRLGLSKLDKTKVLNKFNGSYKDVALEGMHKDWSEFLKTDDKLLPPELLLVSAHIEDAGGAGNLKHVESLGNFAYQINGILENPETTKRTKNEIKKMLNNQEARISREKWLQDDRSEFYNISHDIVEAAPSLYSSLSPLLEQLSPKEVKVFMNETLPLFQAQLITKQNIDERDGEVSYAPRELVDIRQTIKDMVEEIKKKPTQKNEIFEKEKNHLIAVIKDSFKERFGILRVPTEFTKENLRSVQNCIRYIGNINNRNTTNEAIIAMYLGLELNGKWEDFRQGKDIKSEEYLVGTSLKIIEPILEEKKKSYEIPLEVAGISQAKAARFQELLQEEVSSNMIGSVQTVDIKLGNVKRNIEELTDPDIYNTEQEKSIIKLLGKSGRMVGAVLAKTYAEVQGKKIEFNEEERLVQAELSDIYTVKQWSPDKVKSIQDQIQPFSLITNMVNKMEEERIDDNIIELHQRLQPSDSIIKLFKSLGEDFSQESGAIALSKDLTYLESLLVKDENKISPEQKAEVGAYLNAIREKMEVLENTLDKIKEYYNKVKKSTHLAGHELLNNRMVEVEKLLYSQDSNEMILSRLTKDLNLIVENMRQCLGCMRKEVNNDTNLAFGDYNKFFIINQAEKEKGSISDEIMFFVPIKKSDGKEEMSFVMDKVYGSKVPDVLISNILSVFKKYQAIKKEIPEARISITVSHEAMASVGLNYELLVKRIENILPSIKLEEYSNNLIATVPKSNLSDNYVEFGKGDARSSGEREFSGLIIH